MKKSESPPQQLDEAVTNYVSTVIELVESARQRNSDEAIDEAHESLRRKLVDDAGVSAGDLDEVIGRSSAHADSMLRFMRNSLAGHQGGYGPLRAQMARVAFDLHVIVHASTASADVNAAKIKLEKAQSDLSGFEHEIDKAVDEGDLDRLTEMRADFAVRLPGLIDSAAIELLDKRIRSAEDMAVIPLRRGEDAKASVATAQDTVAKAAEALQAAEHQLASAQQEHGRTVLEAILPDHVATIANQRIQALRAERVKLAATAEVDQRQRLRQFAGFATDRVSLDPTPTIPNHPLSDVLGADHDRHADFTRDGLFQSQQ
jgi:hypothetical protein